MSLTRRVIGIVVLIFGATLTLDIYRTESIITSYHQEQRRRFSIEAENIGHHLQRLQKNLQTQAQMLASTTDVSQAIQATDNNVLSTWGKGLLATCDLILFTDNNGRVLARVPDEFRFGDLISEQSYYPDNSQEKNGLAIIDGQLLLYATSPILQYSDTTIGSVILGVALTADRLASFADYPGSNLVITAGSMEIQSNRNQDPVIHQLDMKSVLTLPPDISMSLTFHDDARLPGLASLRRGVYLRACLGVVLGLGLLVVLLRRFLHPYSQLIRLISAHAAGTIDRTELKEQLNTISQGKEQTEAADAISQLLATIDKKHQELESSRNQLAATVKELRQSLDEVHTLSELLPICSYCKMIRDDQGYWSRLEEYFATHQGTTFSHGICPDCMRRHFPEYLDNKEKHS